jgi:hypothetical protein
MFESILQVVVETVFNLISGILDGILDIILRYLLPEGADINTLKKYILDLIYQSITSGLELK